MTQGQTKLILDWAINCGVTKEDIASNKRNPYLAPNEILTYFIDVDSILPLKNNYFHLNDLKLDDKHLEKLKTLLKKQDSTIVNNFEDYINYSDNGIKKVKPNALAKTICNSIEKDNIDKIRFIDINKFLKTIKDDNNLISSILSCYYVWKPKKFNAVSEFEKTYTVPNKGLNQ